MSAQCWRPLAPRKFPQRLDETPLTLQIPPPPGRRVKTSCPQPPFTLPIRWLPTQRPLGVPTVTDPTFPSSGRSDGAGGREGEIVGRREQWGGRIGVGGRRRVANRQFAVSARYVRTFCAILASFQALFKGLKDIALSLTRRKRNSRDQTNWINN